MNSLSRGRGSREHKSPGKTGAMKTASPDFNVKKGYSFVIDDAPASPSDAIDNVTKEDLKASITIHKASLSKQIDDLGVLKDRVPNKKHA